MENTHVITLCEANKDGKEIDSVISRIINAQKGKLTTIRDIFRLKHESQGREKEMVESIAHLSLHCDSVVKEGIKG